MSPITSSGIRTFARIIVSRMWLGSPASMYFMMGMASPSSYTSRASAPRGRPPKSHVWHVQAKKATGAPL